MGEQSKNGKVHEIAAQIRMLNKLDENVLYVPGWSWSQIIYAGDFSKLTLPAGYYISTYNDRGKERPCITNKGNTGTNAFWTFFISTQ